MLVLPSGNLFLWWVRSFFADEPLQLSLSNENFYLLLQVVVVSCVMTMVTVKATILVSKPLIRISLQLAEKCQSSFVFDLHQDLVDWGNQQCEACKPLRGVLKRLSSCRSPVLAIFHSLSCRTSSCLSLFLGFSSWANSVSSAFMYFIAL